MDGNFDGSRQLFVYLLVTCSNCANPNFTLKLVFSASILWQYTQLNNLPVETSGNLMPEISCCESGLAQGSCPSLFFSKILCIFHIDMQAILMIKPQHLMKKNRFEMFLKQ